MEEKRDYVTKDEAKNIFKRLEKKVENMTMDIKNNSISPKINVPTPQSTVSLPYGGSKTTMMYPDGTVTEQIREAIFANTGGFFGSKEIIGYSFKEEICYSPTRGLLK